MGEDWIARPDLWKNKARSLQLLFRDRFRVAVDRQRRRSRILDDNFSSTMQRLLNRIRSFRRDSLSSSAAFYRKRVVTNIDADEDSVIIRMLQALAVPVIGNVCHVFMHGFNRIQVYGAEKLHQALLQRPENKSLLTVSNHVASVDDPFVIASLLPPSIFLNAHSLRWTLCATDRCFSNPATSAFFRCVKVLPVSRGDGIYQKGLDMAISKLNNGGWVHIFPEGSRSRDGGKTMGSAKRGVGRLVLDADNIPVVLPFVHTGMQEIMPIGAKFPRVGKTVTVLIGDPIVFDDLLNMEETQDVSRGKVYDAVASRIGSSLQDLKIQVDKLAFEQAVKLQNYSLRSIDRAAGLLQQVDWESFGMGSYVSSEDDSFTMGKDIPIQSELNFAHFEEYDTSNRYFKMGFFYQVGIVSRIRGYMDHTELMGFAARGLFMNRGSENNSSNLREVGPLEVWNRFLEANLLQQWHSI